MNWTRIAASLLDIDASYGAHLEWNGKLGPSPINVILRARKHSKSARGTQADLRLTAGIFQAGPFAAGLVGQATWADSKSTASFYGVSGSQAVASGISAYAPGSGWLASSIALIWSLDLAPHWVVVGNFEGRRLHGDAAHSPLSERRSNYYATVGLAYRF